MKNFTFKKFINFNYPKNYVPTEYFSVEDEVKAKMLKKGYLVKDLKNYETITISCTLAKANIPLEERKKIQKELDGSDPT